MISYTAIELIGHWKVEACKDSDGLPYLKIISLPRDDIDEAETGSHDPDPTCHDCSSDCDPCDDC